MGAPYIYNISRLRVNNRTGSLLSRGVTDSLEALILCPDFRDTASTVYVVTFKYMQVHADSLCNIFTSVHFIQFCTVRLSSPFYHIEVETAAVGAVTEC